MERENKILLCCNDCYSSNVRVYEGKMTELGYDWFKCNDCQATFQLRTASYSQE